MKSMKKLTSTSIAAMALTLLLTQLSSPAKAGTYSTDNGPSLNTVDLPEALGFKLFSTFQKTLQAVKTCGLLQSDFKLFKLRMKLLEVLENQTLNIEGQGFEQACEKGGDAKNGQLLIDNGTGDGGQLCYSTKSDCGGAVYNFLNLDWGTDFVVTPWMFSGMCGRIDNMVLSAMIERFGNLKSSDAEKVAMVCLKQLKLAPQSVR